MGGTRAQKADYFEKLRALLTEFKSLFLVGVDNVGSNQMHQIRQALRGDAVILLGKNTMIRRAIRGFLNEFPDYERLLPYVKGNVGFVFTNRDLKEIREKITANRVAAPARAGAIAPLDVFIPAINTGLDPSKTSFFQALGVPTKIARGTIEIVNEVHLVHKTAKVGASEATLLNMLNISPFTYGMVVQQVFDSGNVFAPSILDIEESSLLSYFTAAIQNVASVSLATGYPTIVSISHSLVNSYKNLLAVSVETDYDFEGSEKIKAYLADPSAFAAAAPAASDAPAAAETAAAAAPAEEEEESDDDMGLDLFG